MNNICIANNLIEFIKQSPTKYHAVSNVKQELSSNGYVELFMDGCWSLVEGGNYFIEQDNSALIAFSIGSDLYNCGFRVACAHTDSPAFKVKPLALMTNSQGCIRLNTQCYGWPILTTWFDRPLSLAGRVAIRGESAFKPNLQLVDMEDPLLIIPSIAHHLTQGKTDGKISKQKEMLPILGASLDDIVDADLLNKIIAKKLNLPSADDILDSELYLYPCEQGKVVGLNGDYIVAPRQDDLAMVYVAYKSMLSAKGESVSRMIAIFDSEEETNTTLGGADSPLLYNIISKIVRSLNGDDDDIDSLIAHSFALSLDISFASHPNYLECSDPTCSPIINKGVSIKYDANMHYATNAFSASVFQEVCRLADIPYQKESSNSDLRTGSTISRFLQSQLQIQCVDVGIASWAMHSAYETCGTKDLYYLIKAATAFMDIEDPK